MTKDLLITYIFVSGNQDINEHDPQAITTVNHVKYGCKYNMYFLAVLIRRNYYSY